MRWVATFDSLIKMDGELTRNSRLDVLAAVMPTTHEVVDQLAPSDLEWPTPCERFDVRRLLEHVIGWQQVFSACAAGEQPPVADGSPTYVSSADVREDLHDASAALIKNLRRRDDRTITVPYRGSISVASFADELIAETVIHTWDLATALGSVVSFDDGTVSAAHEGLSKLLGASFASMGFRAPRGTASPRSEFERLLQRSGRSPTGQA